MFSLPELPKIPTLSEAMDKIKGGTAVKSPGAEVVKTIQEHTAVLSARGHTVINGFITGTTLTVNSFSMGGIQVGQVLESTAAPLAPPPDPLPQNYVPPVDVPRPAAGTVITAQLDGFPGEEGTYTVSIAQELSTTEMKAYIPGSLYASINATTTQIDADLLGFSNSLLTSLPLFGASEKITLKAKVADGITPAAGPSTDFKTAVAPTKDIPAQLEQLSKQLLYLVNFDPAGSAIEVQREYDKLVFDADKSFLEANAKKSQMIGGLKAFATVAMMASPANPAVAGILSSIMTIPAPTGGPAALDKIKEKVDIKKVADVTSAQPLPTAPASKINITDALPKPALPAVDTPAGDTTKDSWVTTYKRNGVAFTIGDIKALWLSEYNVRTAEINKIKEEKVTPSEKAMAEFMSTNWKSPTYEQIKEKANGWFASDADKAAYRDANADYKMNKDVIAYNKAVSDYNFFVNAQKWHSDTLADWTKATGGINANFTSSILDSWRSEMPDELKKYDKAKAPVAIATPSAPSSGWRW